MVEKDNSSSNNPHEYYHQENQMKNSSRAQPYFVEYDESDDQGSSFKAAISTNRLSKHYRKSILQESDKTASGR